MLRSCVSVLRPVTGVRSAHLLPTNLIQPASTRVSCLATSSAPSSTVQVERLTGHPCTPKLRQGPAARDAAAMASSTSTGDTFDATSRDFNSQIHQYAEDHSNFYSHNILRELEEATWATRPRQAHMLAGPLPGSFLNTLVAALCWSGDSSALVLELGTFTGHSALCMAEALPRHGRLITCELDESNADFARQHFDRHPTCSHSIHIARGPAERTLEAIADIHQSCTPNNTNTVTSSVSTSDASNVHPSITDATLRPLLLSADNKRQISRGFDLIFIDANKQQYKHYYDFIIKNKLLRRGGMMVVDNTLWNGRVCDDPATHRGTTKTIHEFNEYVANDTRTCKTLIPLRDGMTVIRLR